MTIRRLWITAVYLIFTILLIIPLIEIVRGSWADGWGGFTQALMRPQSLHALGMTGIIVIVVTLINTMFGVMLALYLVRAQWIGPRIKRLLNSLVDLPFAVSPVIGGLMIVLLLGPSTVIGALFEDAGFKVVYALPGMILATLFVTFPIMVREVLPVLQEIGAQQEEAASTLGAYSWYTFWKVTWPSIRWGVIYGVVLTVARSLGEFGAVLVVSGNIMNKTQTATTLVYQDVENFNVVAANGVALVLAVFSVGLLLLMEWAKKRKEVH
ncbi:sulfate ABC transporter permease subunit CysW [Paenibacillus radicis (ex Gao et al. 2016)]|uniref:Sulfate ABC transporter permease subunit CysW n=1 Tax=Paenibacillus radicis (ex Gao et al. 2016) TaxID=1737354 RepID=A0A917HDY6_9BACL|nr:sulfate ABC transporter permease subunit CysW [Paenibacillus radicis (ex Gao et al. 2016)]